MAIGGMRNPHLAVQRLPSMKGPGAMVRLILEETQRASPELTAIGRDILTGRVASPFPEEVVTGLRVKVAEALGRPYAPRNRTAKADTPLEANIVEAWGTATQDPDTTNLCQWLDHGAPLGYSEPIPARAESFGTSRNPGPTRSATKAKESSSHGCSM